MHILIAAPYARNTPHFETELELAQRHFDRDDEVDFLVCDSALPACDVNADHSLKRCLNCMGRRRDGMQKLSASPRIDGLLNLREEDKRKLASLPRSFDQAELRALTIGQFDIGMGVLSSLISKTRKVEFDLSNGPLSALARDLLHSAAAVYLSTKNYVDERRPDRVYVFNGRYAIVRAVLRACQEIGTECYTHERGCDLNHFELYRNTLPHDRKYIEREIHRYWNESDAQERQSAGEGFYQQRVQGSIPNWHSFTDSQERSLLPTHFDHSQHNVAIYSSSEDEFAAIGEEWKNPVYESQLSGTRRVIRDLAGDEGVHVYIRVHPNLEDVENKQTEALATLEEPGCTVISASSPVSSYALLKASDNVLTFGSTMGAEATYWRKPSVLAGIALYRGLGVTYNPGSHEQVLDLLRTRDLAPKPLQPALMYGFYQATKGIPFKYFEGEDVFAGRFRGEPVTGTPSLLYRIGGRLARSGKMQPIWKRMSDLGYGWTLSNVGGKK